MQLYFSSFLSEWILKFTVFLDKNDTIKKKKKKHNNKSFLYKIVLIYIFLFLISIAGK